MTLPANNLTFNAVNVENGLSGTAQVSLNDAAVRSLFGVPSGQISFSDGLGKIRHTQTLTCGQYVAAGSYTDVGLGTSPSPIGSISPTTQGGYNISLMYQRFINAGSSYQFLLQLDNAGLAQSFFTSIWINGITYASASAALFGHDASHTYWRWDGTNTGLVNGNSYPVLIQ